ncbi:hypothetical protein V6N13_014721 [Hibiscus sabdariffa]
MTKLTMFVVAAVDVQNEEFLKSGNNGDGEFKYAEEKYVAESVTEMNEIESVPRQVESNGRNKSVTSLKSNAPMACPF